MDSESERVEAAERCLEVLTYHPMITRRWEPTGEVTMAVYGRYCKHLARTIAYVVRTGQPDKLGISGNKGKDSGELVRAGIAEAYYLLSAADVLSGGLVLSVPEIFVDLNATNGIENSENMVAMLQGHVQGGELVVVTHSTQTLRLGLTMHHALRTGGMKFDRVTLLRSEYRADPARLLDQWEIFFEICRIVEMNDLGQLEMSGIEPDIVLLARAGLAKTSEMLTKLGVTAPSTAGLQSA